MERMGPEEPEVERQESADWLSSLDDVLRLRGPERVVRLLRQLQIRAQRAGVELPVTARTPYLNTIPPEREAPFPGDRALERRIKSLIRWNALAMVVRANRESPGIGGHISSYASAATLYEVGFNHFFRGAEHESTGDLVYFQGHAAPGIYARAFLEGRLSEAELCNFRRERAPGGGLSSYPHPWLMPEFWQFPTVSMGLGPIMAIYQARFVRYLADRGLKPYTGAKVWAFLGDGETDEPESLGAITLAARERLDNLIFVVNCNLQRLDGPVRGNGSIVQELEAIFRGSGWNVIKCLWGSDFDPLLAADADGLLARRMGEIVDGEYQKYAAEGGAYIRRHFWGADPRLAAMVRQLSDQQLWKLRLGGHDPVKVHAAFRAAADHRDQPSVILARTIKGYGLGEAGEGKNITHQQKKLNEEELLDFRDRFEIPLSDAQVRSGAFYRPPEGSAEMVYLRERRGALGGPVPRRRAFAFPGFAPEESLFEEFLRGTGDREASTTMAFVRLLARLMRDKSLGRHIVPIIPDEARTFGMEGMFRQFGIYSHVGQLYEPVDADQLAFYKEAKDGAILEEGITEAGSMSSFIAAGSAGPIHGVPALPFYIYYSMFGFQRIGDLAWAAGDMRCRGFMIGGTAGRTTLAGEGLQHQDGHSLLLAATLPNLRSYDPAYAYELAVIVRAGIRDMYTRGAEVFYYLTVENEAYPQPPMPEGVEQGILEGLYRVRTPGGTLEPAVTLLGSGPLLPRALEAAALLEERFGLGAEVWSVTSWTELRREALAWERAGLLGRPDRPDRPLVARALAGSAPFFVAVTDYMKALPDGVARWLPGPLHSLGTDGFGRSESRAALREFFEVDTRFIALAAARLLAGAGRVDAALPGRIIQELGIDPDKSDPAYS